MSKSKALSFLFTFLLLLSGLLFCIRPVCADLIREAYIGRAVALRMNDVIFAHFPDMDIEAGIAIQEKMERHRQLNRMTAAYLDAVADCVGSGAAWSSPDVSEAFEKLSQDVILALQQEGGCVISPELEAQLLTEFREKQGAVLSILEELPSLPDRFGRPARAALILYRFLTSVPFTAAVLFLTAAIGILLYFRRKENAEWIKSFAAAGLADGIVLAILLPLLIQAVTLPLTNRVLGRSMFIDVSAFRLSGTVLLLAGGLLAAFRLLSRHAAAPGADPETAVSER